MDLPLREKPKLQSVVLRLLQSIGVRILSMFKESLQIFILVLTHLFLKKALKIIHVYILAFADVKSQRVEKKAEYLRDQSWFDQTCTLGYSVAGTWNNLGYKNDPTTTTAVHVGNHR